MLIYGSIISGYVIGLLPPPGSPLTKEHGETALGCRQASENSGRLRAKPNSALPGPRLPFLQARHTVVAQPTHACFLALHAAILLSKRPNSQVFTIRDPSRVHYHYCHRNFPTSFQTPSLLGFYPSLTLVPICVPFPLAQSLWPVAEQHSLQGCVDHTPWDRPTRVHPRRYALVCCIFL